MKHPATSRAPGRVELLGNHTDYNDGVVLSAAINYAVTTRGEAVTERQATVTSGFAPEPVNVSLDALSPLEGRVIVGELFAGG